MSKTFSLSDVASHSKPDNLYIVIDEDVYDLTTFADDHPGMFPFLSVSQSYLHQPFSSSFDELQLIHPLTTGGKKILTRVAGKDASKQFWKYHNEGILKKYAPKLKVGSLDTKKQAAPPTPPPSPPPAAKPSTLAAPVPVEEEDAEPLEPFGDQVPYADPSWYQSVSQ